MKRILIIGGNGCGKTTFSIKLAAKLELPLIHLDTLFWRDNWQGISKEDFDPLLLAELSKPKWIIEGNIKRTLPLRLKFCDTVIFMDFSRSMCVYGALKRVLGNYGKSRPDMGGYCPEILSRQKFEFIMSIWHNDKVNRAQFYDMLNHESAVAVNKIIFRNRRQADIYLQSL